MSNATGWIVVAMLAWSVAVPAAAPNLVLTDLAGTARNVSEFIGHGKWTVVAVWSADCPICKRDIHHMGFFHEAHKQTNAQVLGLSVDGRANRARAQGFAAEQGLDFPNLIGTREDAERIGRTRFIGTPTYYFFAPDGALMGQRVGSVTQPQAEAAIREYEAQRAKRN